MAIKITSESSGNLKKSWDTDRVQRSACLAALSEHASIAKNEYKSRNTLSSRLKIASRYIRVKTDAAPKHKPLSRYMRSLCLVTAPGCLRLQSRSPEGKPRVSAPDSAAATEAVSPESLAQVSKSPVLPPSMSRRRIASNIPALDSSVQLPSPPQFPDSSSNQQRVLDSAVLRGLRTPVTPLEQIIHTPEDPPSPFRSRMLTQKPKLSVLTTVRAAPAARPVIDASAEVDSPYIPFTPLDSPELSSTPTSQDLAASFDKLSMHPAYPFRASPSPSDIAATGSTLAKRSKLPLSLPRRLSYKAATSTINSTLTPNLNLQSAEGSGLASPFPLKLSLSAKLQPLTPCLSSPPLCLNRSPGGYF